MSESRKAWTRLGKKNNFIYLVDKLPFFVFLTCCSVTVMTAFNVNMSPIHFLLHFPGKLQKLTVGFEVGNIRTRAFDSLVNQVVSLKCNWNDVS